MDKQEKNNTNKNIHVDKIEEYTHKNTDKHPTSAYPFDVQAHLESDGHSVKTGYKKPASYSWHLLESDGHSVKIKI